MSHSVEKWERECRESTRRSLERRSYRPFPWRALGGVLYALTVVALLAAVVWYVLIWKG